ncbi:MAG: hypothetical protein WAL35_03180 [Acidimicrobiales bacterium]
MSFTNPPVWQAATPYQAGIDEVTVGGLVYLCTRSGISGSSAPSWPTTFNASVADGACSWVCAQNARATWQPDHPYTAGPLGTGGPYPNPDQVIAGGALWQCTTSGTSGSSEPAWSFLSATTIDGSVTWALDY